MAIKKLGKHVITPDNGLSYSFRMVEAGISLHIFKSLTLPAKWWLCYKEESDVFVLKRKDETYY